MADNTSDIEQKFFNERNRHFNRFPGSYRAVVIETNDPLNIGRIRFKCPDMHEYDLPAEDCPWAVPANYAGMKRAGNWVSPCIGDQVWIQWEKGSPFGPIWYGFATPTRRKFYALPSIHQKTPLSLNENGEPEGQPSDYNEEYLPKDGRPMSMGFVDRYGNADIVSSVGFYPIEHGAPPPPPDFDVIQSTEFSQSTATPEANSPDVKLMARISKYGNIRMSGDQGYAWKKDGEYGEFDGDFAKDEQFEIDRWKYIQRVLNEDKTTGNDQRNLLDITRYGHRFELRDTGWAQPGPTKSKSRKDEYGSSQYLSKEKEADYRWAKLRTKGGWLLQAYDKGFDPAEDEFIKRNIIDELGPKSDKEDIYWKDKDARWFRMIGRHGFKFVIDERGTDSKSADKKENPRGNGILIKGRRTAGCKKDKGVEGNPTGFYFEFNEQDDANHTTWGTPMGSAIEMNDATEYVAITCGMGKKYARPWKGLEENEFLLEPTRSMSIEEKTHHLVIDNQNQFIRLKTRAGKGEKPGDDKVNPVKLDGEALNQGLEARDGSNGDGPWVELVDSEHRGMWFSKEKKLGVWRGKKDKKLYVYIDDDKDSVVVWNGETSGKIQVFSKGDIELISKKNITLQGQNINIRANEKVNITANGTPFVVSKDRLETRANYYGSTITAFVNGVKEGPGAGTKKPGGDPVQLLKDVVLPEKLEPEDRAKTYNEPSVISQDQIEHPIKK